MGIITVEKSDNLFWLGRYIERVNTTLSAYFMSHDNMIDKDPNFYKVICDHLGIDDVYGSREAFTEKYPFDENDPNSLWSSIMRAYDNAVVLRDVIGSDTLSYIQLAIYDMEQAKDGSAIVGLQHVHDRLMAFWGSAEENIFDEKIYSILRAGKCFERLELYFRFNSPVQYIEKELDKLKRVAECADIALDQSVVDTLATMLLQDNLAYSSMLALYHKILEAQ